MNIWDFIFETDDNFHIHTPKFLKEVVENSGQRMYSQAWNVFFNYLKLIAVRATELHDPIIDAIMVKMTMYEFDDYETILKKLKHNYDEIR